MRADLLHILQHSLGVDQYGRGQQYRNYFCAGGKDIDKCRELVVLGYMEQSRCGVEPTFIVTKTGINAMHASSPRPPKLTRSQKRYADYLKVADCFKSFKHYIVYRSKADRIRYE